MPRRIMDVDTTSQQSAIRSQDDFGAPETGRGQVRPDTSSYKCRSVHTNAHTCLDGFRHHPACMAELLEVLLAERPSLAAASSLDSSCFLVHVRLPPVGASMPSQPYCTY